MDIDIDREGLLKDLVEHRLIYRWHDLRTNESDLPMHDGQYWVVYDDGDYNIASYYHDGGWNREDDSAKTVIAWQQIDYLPEFEEVDDE